MRFGISALLTALATLALTSPLHASDIVGGNDVAPANPRVCATPDVSRDEQLAVQKQVEDWLSENPAAAAVGGNIQIAWHVIHDGVNGNIPQSMIDATVVALNDCFAGIPGGVSTGYTFSLASVDRTLNASWYFMTMGSSQERQAKRALALDVPHRLNIYSTRSPSGNWAHFPSSWTERNYMHGAVLHYGYLPGSYAVPLNTGDVAVHEVGHYLGLYHTFQGGCSSPGDEVDDTPYENGGATCCPCPAPETRDTCPASPGWDPIQNYMAYTGDACKTEFTAGQDARMDILVPQYRPSLLNAPRPAGGPLAGLGSSDRRDDLATHDRVQRIDSASPSGGVECPEFLIEWGAVGSGDGQFLGPNGVATDAAGNVYVVDQDNCRIQKFTTTGVYVTQWGSCGVADGQFYIPHGVAVDPAGDVYVVDYGNHRVQKFTNTGTYVTQWGSNGTGDGQFNYPVGITTDAAGSIYVTELSGHRVQKFTGSGAFVTKWGTYGTGNGQFSGPYGIDTDAAGDVYVAEEFGSRVQKFSGTGTYLTQWGSSGTGEGQFNEALALTTDAGGNVYVEDRFNNRIQKFTSSGAYLCQFPAPSASIYGLTADAGGRLYVSDHDTHRIVTYAYVTPFAGLPNYRLGDAVLTATPESLLVSDLGSSGQDGVAIHIENFLGLDFTFGGEGLVFCAPGDSGAALDMTLMVAVPESSMVPGPLAMAISQPGVKISSRAQSDRVKVGCDFSGLDATTCRLRILNDYVVQYDAVVPTTTVVDVYPAPPSPIDVAIGNPGVKITNDEGGDGTADAEYTAVRLDYAQSYPMVVNGTPLTGDEIVWERTTGFAAEEILELRIQATSPPGACLQDFSLRDLAPRILGAHVSAQGGVMMQAAAAGPGAMVSFQAPGGGDVGQVCKVGDGIKEVDVEVEKETGGIPVDYFEATYGGLDPEGSWPTGAEMAWHAEGLLEGSTDEVGLGDCISISKSGVKIVECDFAAIGASTKAHEVKDAGGTLYTGTTTDSIDALVARYPDAVRYDIAATAAGDAGYVLSWSTPVTVTVAGNDYEATELVVGVAPGIFVRAGGGATGGAITGGPARPVGVTALPVEIKYIPGFSVTAITFPDIQTGVATSPTAQAAGAVRMTVWPNPGPGPVSFRFSAPRATHLKVDIYDVAGRHVREIADRSIAAGQHVMSWDGRNDDGQSAAPGMYFVRGRYSDAGRAVSSVAGRFVLVK